MTPRPGSTLLPAPASTGSASLEDEAAPLEYAKEILITKSELEEKNQLVANLQNQVGNLKEGLFCLQGNPSRWEHPPVDFFGMFRHPPWAVRVDSYNSGLPVLWELSQQEVFSDQNCHPVIVLQVEETRTESEYQMRLKDNHYKEEQAKARKQFGQQISGVFRFFANSSTFNALYSMKEIISPYSK